MYMFDSNKETCWNSDQGSPQSILIELPHAAKVNLIEITFQGGFAARECVLLGGDSVGRLAEIQKVYPADNNSDQVSFFIVS